MIYIIYNEHAYVLVWEWLAASLNLVVPTREGTQSLWFGAHVTSMLVYEYCKQVIQCAQY